MAEVSRWLDEREACSRLTARGWTGCSEQSDEPDRGLVQRTTCYKICHSQLVAAIVITSVIRAVAKEARSAAIGNPVATADLWGILACENDAGCPLGAPCPSAPGPGRTSAIPGQLTAAHISRRWKRQLKVTHSSGCFE